jgi:hypothetical protein
MRMNGKAALCVGAAAAVAVLAACSDTATAPIQARNLQTPSLDIGDVTTSTPVLGQIKICKTGNVGGTFNLSVKTVVADVEGAPAAGTPVSFTDAQAQAAGGTCKVALESNGTSGNGLRATITEVAAGNTAQSLTSCSIITVPVGGGNPSTTSCSTVVTSERFINQFHGYVITYNNTFTPPPPPPDVCDFSTFGGFVLENNYNISYGGNAGRVKDGNAYGDLQFTNHTTGDKVHVWNVTGYGHPASGPLSNYPDSRYAIGMGAINESGSFPVEFRFVDRGEPGVNDRVWLKVNGAVWIQEQVVQGGNVQLHSVCKKTPSDEKH